jgi:serine protease
MTPGHSRATLLRLLTLASGMTLAGCASDALDANEVDVLEGQYRVMPFEQYRDRALREVDGQRFYQVEFDLYFASEEDLYAYYLERVEQELSKSTAMVDPSTGKRATWVRNGNALNIRYCVSDDFGADHAAVEADVAEAMHGWESIANLHYVYVPSQNSTCMGANATIDLSILPGGGGACGTPPYLPPAAYPVWCPGWPFGSLGINYEGWPWQHLAPFPNITLVGVFRHELGHINGFRHEHVRAPHPHAEECDEDPVLCSPPGTCVLGSDYLTGYDPYSVMHYPDCGDPNTAWEFTESDGIGARILYGMPAAWYVPVIAN